MFSRSPVANRQSPARPGRGVHFGFAIRAGEPNDGSGGWADTVTTNSEDPSYPSPVFRPVCPGIRPGLFRDRCDDRDDNFVHGDRPAFFPFPAGADGIDSGPITTNARGKAVCVFLRSFSQWRRPCRFQPACRTIPMAAIRASRTVRPPARSVVPWLVQSSPISRAAAGRAARLSVQWPVARPAPFPARPAATDTLAPRGVLILARTIRADCPDGSLRFVSRPIQKGLPCSRRS